MDNLNPDKKLQEQLQAFTASAPADGFAKIAARLRKQKRRRAAFIILPVGILLGLGIIFFHSQTNKYSQLKETAKIETERSSSPDPKTIKREAIVADAKDLSPSKFSSGKPDLTATSATGNLRIKKSKSFKNEINKPIAAAPSDVATSQGAQQTTATSSANGLTDPDKTNETQIQQLELIKWAAIPLENESPELITKVVESQGSVDSASKSKLKWLLGFGFAPQLNCYAFAPNGMNNAKVYADHRRNGDKLHFGWQAMLNLGFVTRRDWEILFSPSLQQFNARETVAPAVGPTVPGPGPVPNTLHNADPRIAFSSETTMTPATSGETYNNKFTYLGLGFAVSRRFDLGKFRHAKLGFELRTNRLVSASSIICYSYGSYYYIEGLNTAVPYRRWNNLGIIRFGFIEQLGKKLQLHVSPSFYLGVQSMYYDNYIISQRPYGLSLDINLLWQLGKGK